MFSADLYYFEFAVNIPELISTNLKDDEKFHIIINKDIIDRSLEELNIQKYKIDEFNTKYIGKKLSVDYVCWGKLYEVNGNIRIIFNLCDVKDEELLFSKTLNGNPSNLLGLIDQISSDLKNFFEDQAKEIKTKRLKLLSPIILDKIFTINPWKSKRDFYSYSHPEYPEINFNIFVDRKFTKIGTRGRPLRIWGCSSIIIKITQLNGYYAEYKLSLELSSSSWAVLGEEFRRIHSLKTNRHFTQTESSIFNTTVDLIDYDIDKLETDVENFYRVEYEGGYFSYNYIKGNVIDYSILWIKVRIRIELKDKQES